MKDWKRARNGLAGGLCCAAELRGTIMASSWRRLCGSPALCLTRPRSYVVRLNSKRVVGRGGLEPPTSAIARPDRCAGRFSELVESQGCAAALSGVSVISQTTLLDAPSLATHP